MSEAAGGSLPYPPQDCPCRVCRFNCSRSGHAGSSDPDWNGPSRSDIQTLARSIENLSAAIAVKLKAMEMLSQNTGPYLAGGKIPKAEPDISKPDFIDYDKKHDILYLGFGDRSNSFGDEANDDFTVMRDFATGKIVGLIVWGFWEKHKGALAAKLKDVDS
jgi:hypothetical protein